MRHGDDDNLFALDRIDEAERKTSDQRAAESIGDGNSKMWSLANGVDGVLYVIEECVSESRSRGLVRRARLRSSLPPRKEGAGSRSPKPAAGSGHGLITWDGLDFSPA